jgi:hypothetical protein
VANQLLILVPYRRRFDHLCQFVPQILFFLHDVDPTVIVIEQADMLPFNRGMLLNIGFHLSPDHEWLALHDIDLLPVDSSCDYSKPDTVAHLAGRAEQFGFQLPYLNYCGGVLLATKSAFSSVNGFSNRYWGWGCEDDDLYVRFRRAGFVLDRRPGRYRSLPHDRPEIRPSMANHERFCQVLRESINARDESLLNPKVFRRVEVNDFLTASTSSSCYDGLSTIRYRLLAQGPLDSYCKFSVSVASKHTIISVQLVPDADENDQT